MRPRSSTTGPSVFASNSTQTSPVSPTTKPFSTAPSPSTSPSSAPQDLCLIASGFLYERQNRTAPSHGRPKYPNIFKLSNTYGLGLPGPAGRKTCITRPVEGGNEFLDLRWAQIPPRGIDYKSILATRCESIHNRKRPHTWDDVFFLNQTRNIIFHMYDDRGLHMIAPTTDDLRDIYQTHNAWILDHNRKQIDETFA